MNEERKRQYFAELAPRYQRITGNTTQDTFVKFFKSHGDELNITASSYIHDNAAGPGTATAYLVEQFQTAEATPRILATDYAPNMITTLDKLKADSSLSGWSKVTTQVLNSENLEGTSDETFSHSINNFSLFTITGAVQSLRETHRTLKTDGTAVILLWKRYAIQHLLAAAQDIVKGEGFAAKHALGVNGPQYFERDVVPNQLIEAGFDKSRLQTIQIDLLVDEGEHWDGLFEMMTTTSIAMGSTMNWSDEEKHQWPNAIKQAMAQEKQKYGGIQFESWITVARK